MVSLLNEGNESRGTFLLMTDTCLYPYRCEWSIRYLWHWMNWIGHADIFVLALLFAYSVAVFTHVSFGLARPARGIDTDNRSRRKIDADSGVKLSSLRSIASAGKRSKMLSI